MLFRSDKCPICNKPILRFLNIKDGYHKTCSISCSLKQRNISKRLESFSSIIERDYSKIINIKNDKQTKIYLDNKDDKILLELKKLTPLELFIYWINERYKIYLNKLDKKEVLTEDLILKNFKFTNINRYLDKTTQYLFTDLLVNKTKDESLLLYNVNLHRNISKIETSQKIGFLYNDDFSKLHKLKDSPYSVMTNSFLRMCKWKGYLSCFKYVYDIRKEILKELKDSNTLKKCFDIIIKVPYNGNFMSYQIVNDLLYTTILDKSKLIDYNKWFELGPGSYNGLLLLKDYTTVNIEGGIKLMEIVNTKKAEYVPLMNLEDIEHSLCEFFKYYTILYGLRNGKKRYTYKLKN